MWKISDLKIGRKDEAPLQKAELQKGINEKEKKTPGGIPWRLRQQNVIYICYTEL